MRLCRSREDRDIAGVCGGLAKYLGWSSSRMRIAWVLATIFTAFAGVVIYFALWYLMPEELGASPDLESPPLQPWRKPF
jgi:phage shock protein PspC (stress-responsive transcriptional regulator)